MNKMDNYTRREQDVYNSSRMNFNYTAGCGYSCGSQSSYKASSFGDYSGKFNDVYNQI